MSCLAPFAVCERTRGKSRWGHLGSGAEVETSITPQSSLAVRSIQPDVDAVCCVDRSQDVQCTWLTKGLKSSSWRWSAMLSHAITCTIRLDHGGECISRFSRPPTESDSRKTTIMWKRVGKYLRGCQTWDIQLEMHSPYVVITQSLNEKWWAKFKSSTSYRNNNVIQKQSKKSCFPCRGLFLLLHGLSMMKYHVAWTSDLSR